MTISELVNFIIDLSFKITCNTVALFFWFVAMIAIWEWLLKIAKKCILYLFPRLKK